MQILIDLPTRQYNNIKDLANTRLADNISYRGIIIEALGSIKRGTVLPSNPTNGDMIKALFPNVKDWEVKEYKAVAGHYVDFGEGTIKIFALDWWNAPYNSESEGRKK